MSEPFLAEIKLISFHFAPSGWALCNGQLLPINQNQALFSLLGTTYGGDGRVNFALPDLRGRVPMHFGGGHIQGERGGEEAHTLTIPELAEHMHPVVGSANQASEEEPGAGVLPASRAEGNRYASPGASTAMHGEGLTSTGGNQPHLNMQPYLAVNFVIALQGIFPSLP
jgi:microcystin-dependent protein